MPATDKLILPRRRLLTGLVAFVAAPAIVRASSLMAVKAERQEFLLPDTRSWDDVGKVFRFNIVLERDPVHGFRAVRWVAA